MLLKIGHIFQATPLITTIINEGRPLPGKGAYRLSRLYAKLKPEADLITARRDTMITLYQHKEMLTAKDAETGEDVQTEAQNFSVPMEKMPEFLAAWAEVANEAIEVDVQQVPLSQLGDAITAGEFVVLDDLVKED